MMISLLFFFGPGCDSDDAASGRLEPTFIEVAGGLSDDAEQTANGIHGYTNKPRTVQVSGTTLDRNAEPYDYNGWVEISVRPGVITGVQGAVSVEDAWGETHWYLQARDGQVNTTLDIASMFGDTRVWVTATSDPNDAESRGSLATGVTETIDIQLPTIQELQDVTDIDDDEPYTTSPLFGEFVTIRTADRQVVVTELDTKGFWVSDLGHIDDEPATVSDQYRGLFVYTFNAPEEVSIGDRLELLGGGVQEYIGTTQLSFPIYEAMDNESLPVPEAALLDSSGQGPTAVCSSGGKPNHDYLETLESGLVQIGSGTIPANFQAMPAGQDSHPDFDSYLEYGQWPLDLDGGCSVQVVSNIAVPEFDPTEHAGETISSISGMLKFVEAGGDRWIIQVVNTDGMPFVELDPAITPERRRSRSHLQYFHGPSKSDALCTHDHVGDHLRHPKD